MQTCASLIAAMTLSISAQANAIQSKYEKLAKEMKIFQANEFARGRGDWKDRLIPKEWTAPWLKLHAAITTGKEKTADLLALLKHRDSKVRTLALAALFDREDPKLLPHIVGMMNDKAATVPEVAIRRAIPFLPFGKNDRALVPQLTIEVT